LILPVWEKAKEILLIQIFQEMWRTFISAAGYLEKNYKSPSLLIGHSLGGAAVIVASRELPTVKAIATIAAPSTLSHVTHLLQGRIDKIHS
jgi:predicted alpha/beta superfamily hydrolase